MIRAIVLIFCLLAGAARAAEPVTVETTWIPLAGGVRLSVDLFRKVGAGGTARGSPVLLEYLPYRKAESLPRNRALYDYFVERGYVVARVDLRGTGQSEGIRVPHEYSDTELDDGEQVIAWLAAQPWANGKVGMFGISWGGFSALQLALRRPPALAAILAVDATEDLYGEDVHAIDGIWHVDSWAFKQDLDNARPAAPDYRIDAAYFAERFDQPPWFLTYLREQRDGPFWRRNSAFGRIAEIEVPMFLIGGWYDGYRSSIARFLKEAKAPLKAMVGPWTHAWPHEGGPGAAIEWRESAVRWFDHFLKGVDNGVEREPRLTWFARDWHEPEPALAQVPGRWRQTAVWPPARPVGRHWHAAPGQRLVARPGAATALTLNYRPAAGAEGGGPVQWWGDVAPDQRPADAASLVFDSPPLTEDIEILGLPRAELAVAASAARANWIVRLSDVAPDGRVTLITGAAANGSQRGPAGASRELPVALRSGQRMRVDLDLHFTAWRFRRGHRLRFAVSHAQWPMFWPTPLPMQSRLFVGGDQGTRFALPVAPKGSEPGPRFAAPTAAAPPSGFATLESGTASGFGELSAVRRDAQTGEAVAELRNASATRLPWGEERSEEWLEHRVLEADPARARALARNRFALALPGRNLEWRAETELKSDAVNFEYRHLRVLLENGVELRRREWRDRVSRDFQ